jgi:hypothetical protein
MKQCTKCKKWKDESQFYVKSRHKDGLSYWCRKCESEYARVRYNRNGRRSRRYFRYEERHRVVRGLKEKRCSRCKKWRPEAQFYRRTRHKDGLSVWCKECADKATNSCRRRRSALRRAGQIKVS